MRGCLTKLLLESQICKKSVWASKFRNQVSCFRGCLSGLFNIGHFHKSLVREPRITGAWFRNLDAQHDLCTIPSKVSASSFLNQAPTNDCHLREFYVGLRNLRTRLRSCNFGAVGLRIFDAVAPGPAAAFRRFEAQTAKPNSVEGWTESVATLQSRWAADLRSCLTKSCSLGS